MKKKTSFTLSEEAMSILGEYSRQIGFNNKTATLEFFIKNIIPQQIENNKELIRMAIKVAKMTKGMEYK